MVDENEFKNIAWDINTNDKYGRTALHYAVISGRLAVAKLLIAKGADVNAKDDDGQTPLHWAEKQNNPEMIRLFKMKGDKDEIRN